MRQAPAGDSIEFVSTCKRHKAKPCPPRPSSSPPPPPPHTSLLPILPLAASSPKRPPTPNPLPPTTTISNHHHHRHFSLYGYTPLLPLASNIHPVLASHRNLGLAAMQYHAEPAWGAPPSPYDVVSSAPAAGSGGGAMERVERLAAENAVVIFSASTCCMCHAVKRLFCGMGVSPAVYELDEDPRGKDMERALMRMLGGSGAASQLPVVFIGGKLVGAMDRVMASHINGTLVPLLKEAGALWL